MPRRSSNSKTHEDASTAAPDERPLRLLSGPTWLNLLLVCAGGFLLVMLALSIVNERGFLAMWRMQGEVAELAREVRAIEASNRELLSNIDRLRHDKGYIERIAREELGLVRPNELVFEFVQ